MTKLQMFYVWAFCHTTDVNTIVYLCPNRPEHILVNTCNSCSDAKGADVVLTSRKNAWKQISSFLYATTQIVCHYANGFDNVESVFLF
jgi:hypothetical protein